MDFARDLTEAPTRITISTRLGQIDALHYRTRRTNNDKHVSPAPVHLIAHGGAFIIRMPEQETNVANYLVHELGCHVIVPDYRVAPESVFPAAEEDMYDAYLWIRANAHPSTLRAKPSTRSAITCAQPTKRTDSRVMPESVLNKVESRRRSTAERHRWCCCNESSSDLVHRSTDKSRYSERWRWHFSVKPVERRRQFQRGSDEKWRRSWCQWCRSPGLRGQPEIVRMSRELDGAAQG
ncbi:alpha/beta hydrolase [Rhodococcus erythropolis]|uniref:alpha/beta hydrolase n=1 Tax=Rhodococcus erythropolis TaxID=1833 RepID=UPI003982AFAD